MPPAGLAAADPNTSGSKDSPVLGMAAAVGAFCMLSTMSLFAKLLSETHHVVDIVFWRNLLATIPFLVAIAFGYRKFLKIESRPGVVITRSVIATLSLICVFATFSLLPLADATALVFTSSLFVPVLGFLVLGERVGRFRWSAVVVGFVGVLFVAQPSGAGWNALGLVFGLSAAMLNAFLGTMLRLLGRTENPITLTFYLVLVGTLLAAPAMPFIGRMPAPDEIWLFLGLGLSGIGMQVLITTAFKYAPAALASVFSYTQIVWASFYGWALFDDWPGVNIVIGAAIIIVSSIVVILRERYLARKGKLPRPAAGG